MKKKLVKILLIINILLFATMIKFVYAQSNVEGKGNLQIKLDVDTSKMQSEKEIKINIKLTSFTNIDTNEPVVITGTLDYEENLFSNVSLEALSGWSSYLNKNKFVLDASKIVEGKNIATLTMKLNEGISSKSTVVKFTNIEVVNEANLDLKDINIETEAIELVKESTKEPPKVTQENTQQSAEEGNTIKDVLTEEKNNNNETKEDPQTVVTPQASPLAKIEKVEDLTTVDDKKMPQTGSGILIYVVIVIIILTAIYSFIRYKKMFD